MLLELIRYVRGYVLIGISGRFPERFINITSRGGIRLWGVERHGDTVQAAMYMSDYRRIRPLARAAGVRLHVLSKCGLPTVAFRWRGRMGIAVGAFVFLLTVFVMSQFIWSIEVIGLDAVSESEVRAQLRDHGLYIGAFRPAINSADVSRAVMLDNGKIGWMAVNITGSYAAVEIREEATPPQLSDYREPMNIKARRDGTILRIEADEGTVVMKEGSGVTAGQLVVSGVREDQLGGSRLVRADARVIAATAYAADFRISDHPAVYVPDGAQGERRTLQLFGLQLPLSGYANTSDDSRSLTRTESARLMDTELPVGVVTEHMIGLQRMEQTLNDRSANAVLEKESQLYEVFSLSHCTVTGRHLTLSHRGGVYTLRVVYDCVEDIAEPSVIGTDDNTQRIRIPSVGKDE